MKKQLVTIAAVLTVGLIAGCGSGGSSTPTTPQGSSMTSISGKVADGYLAGATVFMDKNGNYQLDPGEPSATTDATGAYTLMNVDPADVGKYPIVALATQGVTKDLDTGAVVANSYVLSMPKDSVSGTVNVNSNFISPMSSQLRVLMDTGKYASMQDAMSVLSTKLGLPVGTNILADYMINPNSQNNANYQNYTVMHTSAQNMAGLMGSQMAQVLSTSGTAGSATTVDVGRYQGMMGAIFSDMSSIKGSNSSSQSAMSSLTSTMTTTLQNTKPGQSFSNISTSIRGMMGGKGSSTSAGTVAGAGTTAGGMM